MTDTEALRLECAKLAVVALSGNATVKRTDIVALTRDLIELVAEKGNPGVLLHFSRGGGLA